MSVENKEILPHIMGKLGLQYDESYASNIGTHLGSTYKQLCNLMINNDVSNRDGDSVYNIKYPICWFRSLIMLFLCSRNTRGCFVKGFECKDHNITVLSYFNNLVGYVEKVIPNIYYVTKHSNNNITFDDLLGFLMVLLYTYDDDIIQTMIFKGGKTVNVFKTLMNSTFMTSGEGGVLSENSEVVYGIVNRNFNSRILNWNKHFSDNLDTTTNKIFFQVKYDNVGKLPLVIYAPNEDNKSYYLQSIVISKSIKIKLKRSIFQLVSNVLNRKSTYITTGHAFCIFRYDGGYYYYENPIRKLGEVNIFKHVFLDTVIDHIFPKYQFTIGSSKCIAAYTHDNSPIFSVEQVSALEILVEKKDKSVKELYDALQVLLKTFTVNVDYVNSGISNGSVSCLGIRKTTSGNQVACVQQCNLIRTNSGTNACITDVPEKARVVSFSITECQFHDAEHKAILEGILPCPTIQNPLRQDGSGGRDKVRFNGRQYKVYRKGGGGGPFIVVKKKKVMLKDIRGRYRYC